MAVKGIDAQQKEASAKEYAASPATFMPALEAKTIREGRVLPNLLRVGTPARRHADRVPRRRGAFRAAATLVAALGLLAVPAGSSAATTIGSDLAPDATANIPECGGLCTYGQISLANQVPGGLVSPTDGVVVRWRLKAGSVGGTVSLRVLRQSGAGSYQGVGRSAPEVVQGELNTWSTRLPIRAGDRLGIDNASQGLYFGGSSGLTFHWMPALGEGESRERTGSKGYQLLLNADVEPDADRDAFGDETQDQCPGDPSSQAEPCAQPGPCANPRGGTSGRDTLIGTAFGDFLRGFSGNDTLLGGVGDDCLDGGRGNDRLGGGDGRDSLKGGSGRDSLKGGRDKDAFNAGSGNDRLNSRDRVRERVRCGRGRDRLTADRRDKPVGCERVRRR